MPRTISAVGQLTALSGVVALAALGVVVRHPERSSWWLDEPGVAAPLGGETVRVRWLVAGIPFEVAVWARARTAARARAETDALLESLGRDARALAEQAAALNRAAGGPPLAVGRPLRTLLARALEWSERTDGAFDVTGGAGAGAVRIVGDTARLPSPDARVDLDGVRTGYLADLLAERLRDAGWPDFVVGAGGVMVVSGTRGGAPWTQEVDDPRERALLESSRARDCAIATGPGGAAVVARRAVDAYALVTAMAALDVDRGLALVLRAGAHARPEGRP